MPHRFYGWVTVYSSYIVGVDRRREWVESKSTKTITCSVLDDLMEESSSDCDGHRRPRPWKGQQG